MFVFEVLSSVGDGYFKFSKIFFQPSVGFKRRLYS